MKIFRASEEIQSYLASIRKEKQSIGFVPTMGALHQGHLSLIEEAIQNNNTVVCSIFVNPTQFDRKEDLEKYPNTYEKDIEMLEKSGCQVLFYPDVNEIYPEKPVAKNYAFGPIANVMEGSKRPGHFDGVATVVSRLFEIINPQHAYFGQKDYQQLAIVKKLSEQLPVSIEIIGCPIVREDDGLAMSSRNIRLDNVHRDAALLLSKNLFYIRDHQKTKSIARLTEDVRSSFEKEALLELEYIEFADADDLSKCDDWSDADQLVVCIAAWAGNVRLIDNIVLK
jgi:pantoate--beta-alanine ligase